MLAAVQHRPRFDESRNRARATASHTGRQSRNAPFHQIPSGNRGNRAFADDDELIQWVKQNPHVCEPKEDDNKAEGQRVDLVDAIRRHANSTHYASRIAEKAAKWAEDATDEWR